MATEQMTLLPNELLARFRYVCKTRTAYGSLQAKCSYIHDGKEYSGILFAADGDGDWLANVADNALIKAHKISPCDIEPYLGEYKGQALPLEQQSLDIMWNPVKTETMLIDMTNTPALLRDAACMIEMLLALTNQAPAAKPLAPTEPAAPFRSVAEWKSIVIDTIKENKRFHSQKFSTLNINSHIETCFNDFWEGDLLERPQGKVRWKTQVTAAVSALLKCNFIARVPGMHKHYQVPQDTLDQLWDPFDD
jgi:hypothetical protein